MKTILILIGCLCGLSIMAAAPAGQPAFGTDTNGLAQQANDKLQQASSRSDFEEAATLLANAAKAEPDNLDLRLTLGWVYLDKLHEPQAAYPWLAAVVKGRSQDVNAMKLYALACSQTGRLREAVAGFRKASALEPNDLWIKANLARSLARFGKHAEAEQIYEEILKADPNNADARLGQAELMAWRGQSGAPLQTLDKLLAENPTNVEALTLTADVHRWDWDLTQAREEYQRVLSIEPNDYDATEGLKEADQMALSDVTAKVYQFKDTTDFLQESAEVDARVHLSDHAYVFGRVAGWQFENPGFSDLHRADGAVGLDYHWARWLETSAEGDVFDYEHHSAFAGGQLSVKLSPMTGFDIYNVLAYNQPFVSSIATVNSALRQESYGNGLDIKLPVGFSVQNSFQLARISDGNTWWEEKPRLSYQVFGRPATFIRVEYDYLSYAHTMTNYWTPRHRHTASPIIDSHIPLGSKLKLNVDARAPYVFDASSFGFQIEGGPSLDITSRIQLAGSYIYSSLPGDRGTQAFGSSEPPWSGHGFQAYLRVQF